MESTGDIHMQKGKDTNVGDCPSSCPEGSPCSSEPVRLAPQALTLQKAITCRMVELQSMWDDAHECTNQIARSYVASALWMSRRRA